MKLALFSAVLLFFALTLSSGNQKKHLIEESKINNKNQYNFNSPKRNSKKAAFFKSCAKHNLLKNKLAQNKQKL